MKTIFSFLVATLLMLFSIEAKALDINENQDYSWQTHIVDAGLSFGTPEWDKARLESIEFANRIKLAQDLSARGLYAEAAEVHPYSWCKSWYLLNELRSEMGGTKGDDGSWSGYEITSEDQRSVCAKLFDETSRHVLLAITSGITGAGSLHVSNVTAYLESYRALLEG